MDDWKSLKRLDPKQREFEANGKQYRIEGSLSLDRWQDMQKLEVELSFATSMEAMLKEVNDIYASLNSRDKLADAAVKCNNLRLGLTLVWEKERVPTILKICCLFINTKDEDRRTINEALINEKVNDWKAEGIDMGSFFQLALSAIPGFLNAYNSVIPSGSPKAEVVASSNPTVNA